MISWISCVICLTFNSRCSVSIVILHRVIWHDLTSKQGTTIRLCPFSYSNFQILTQPAEDVKAFYKQQKTAAPKHSRISCPLSPIVSKNFLGAVGVTTFWCPKWDLNPYGFLHSILSRTRIPIPPFGHILNTLIWLCTIIYNHSQLVVRIVVIFVAG